MSATYTQRSQTKNELKPVPPRPVRAPRVAGSGPRSASIVGGPPAIRLSNNDTSSYRAAAGARAAGQAPPAPARLAQAVAPPRPVPAAGPAALSWTHVRGSPNDALWFFCGEHPSGFSTSARLRATGFTSAPLLAWRITQGADKIAFETAARGAEVRVRSIRGGARANDVAVELREGAGATAPTFVGHLTVRKPHRLIPVSVVDHATGPASIGCSAGCTAFWSEIRYRVMDNVHGTIVGATVNEVFPGGKTNDQPNDWALPNASTPFWSHTSGVFVDNWWVCCLAGPPCCVIPAPAPGTPQAAQGVDRIPHEFFVGSRVPGHGCRVQTHIAHRFRGRARHEGIVTPAP